MRIAAKFLQVGANVAATGLPVAAVAVLWAAVGVLGAANAGSRCCHKRPAAASAAPIAGDNDAYTMRMLCGTYAEYAY